MVEPIFLRVPQAQPYQPVAPTIEALSGTAIDVLKLYQQQQKQLAEQETLRQQKMQFQQDMRTYTQDPSATNYTMILTRYPQLKDQMAKAHEAMSEQQRQAKLSYLQPAYAAFVSGDIPTATLGLAERRTALQNAGKTQEALAVDNLIKAMNEKPNAARVQFHMQMSSLLGPDKAAESFKMFEMMPAETQKAEAEAGIKQAEKSVKEKELEKWDEEFALKMDVSRAQAYAARKGAETAARRLGLDEEEFLFKFEESLNKLAVNTDYDRLPSPIKQKVNEIQKNSSEMSVAAGQLLLLAQAYEDGEVQGFGAASKLNESIKRFLGIGDPTTLVRLQYGLRRKVAAMQQLRGTGSVSNFELQTFLQGWPEGTDDIRLVTAFLRGQAKAAQISSALGESEAQWISNNQGVLGPAASDMVIGGIPVKQGMTFGDFQRQYGTVLLNEFFPERNEERNRARGYINP